MLNNKENFNWIIIIDEHENKLEALISIIDINNKLYAIVSFKEDVEYLIENNDYINWRSNVNCVYFHLEIDNNKERFLTWINDDNEYNSVKNFIDENLNYVGQNLNIYMKEELEEPIIKFKNDYLLCDCLLCLLHDNNR